MELEQTSGGLAAKIKAAEGVNDIIIDCETNGLRRWAGDRPFGHAGGNLDEEDVKRWARLLRGRGGLASKIKAAEQVV
jgi:hypothetical protein